MMSEPGEVDRRSSDRGWPRPDASMSLLTDLLSERGDGAYDAAARRRSNDPQPRVPPRRSQPWRLPAFVLTLTLIALALTTSALAQRRTAGGLAVARTSLETHVRTQARVNRDLQVRIATAERANEAARRRAASLRDDLLQAVRRTDVATAQVGLTAVAGPGFTVTVDDRSATTPVTDRDMQQLVNALWVLGATDIAIGGHRLLATSAIRTAGEAILVDYRPLVAPYPVAAIAPAATQATAARALRPITVRLTAVGVLVTVTPNRSVALAAGTAPALRRARAGS